MNIVLSSVNNKAYQPLANITNANKLAYANKHGYQTHFKNSNFRYIPNDQIQPAPNLVGWEKINAILDAFDMYKSAEYVWLSDCDSMITNTEIDVADIISKYDDHIMVTCDRGGINTGQIICKNTTEAKTYLTTMLSRYTSYRDENQYVIENYPRLMSIIPQKLINSYDYGDHQAIRNTIYSSVEDMNGKDGQWRPGDFVIHWAAGTLPMRLAMAPVYLDLVADKIDYNTFSKLIKTIRNE